MAKVLNDLKGAEFNNWTVIKYTSKSKWLCRCKLCRAEREISGYFLRKGQIPKCNCETGTNNKGLIDLKDRTFGEWKVLEYAGDKNWKCRCSCGTIQIIAGSDLRNGKTTKCKNHTANKMIGKHFGEWEVLSFVGDGLCECRCSCGTVKAILAYSLTSGASKSCGHATTGLKDIIGKTFGYLEVKERLQDGRYRCICHGCGHNYIVDGYRLRAGNTKSCGCKANENRVKTCKIKYGVNYAAQIGTSRSKEELEYVNNEEALVDLINKLQTEYGYATIHDLSIEMNLDRGSVYSLLQRRNLLNMVRLNDTTSHYERELNRLFNGAELHNRDMLNGQEIDLWFPDKKLGIEFNGNYWHNEFNRSQNYHLEKTKLALKREIHLIHIFEYEWSNDTYRNKLISYINSILHSERNKVINARNCIVEKLDAKETDDFLNRYHLQNTAASSIRLGLRYNSEIIGVMTFGKPRFNNNYEYELIRLAYKSDIIVNGGTEKMFKHFLDEYKPSRLVSYCDMSKFTGTTYLRLGFKVDAWSNPNYVWFKDGQVLSRYETQKEKLVKNGLGMAEETETEIMHRLGYYRIFNSGNIRFVWNRR